MSRLIPRRYMEPALYNPAKVPVGPVKINWANSITKKLHAAIVYRNGFITNLLTGQVIQSPGQAIGESTYLDNTVSFTIDIEPLADFTDMSIFMDTTIGELSSFDEGGGIFSIPDTATLDFITLERRLTLTSTFSIRAQAEAQASSSGVPGCRTFALTLRDTTYHLYANGQQTASVGNLNNRDNCDNIIYINAESTNSSYGDQYFRSAWVFSRALEAGEVASLNQRPYQLLLPA